MAHLRRLCLIATACATLLSLALAVNCLATVIGLRESTRELLRQANARGLSAAPVYGFYVIERTSEFYAGERVVRDAGGEVLRFEGAAQVLEAARQSDGTILVFVPIDGLVQLTEFSLIETEIIGDNGTVALVAVKSRQAGRRQ
jgi:hypothetical protein